MSIEEEFAKSTRAKLSKLIYNVEERRSNKYNNSLFDRLSLILDTLLEIENDAPLYHINQKANVIELRHKNRLYVD